MLQHLQNVISIPVVPPGGPSPPSHKFKFKDVDFVDMMNLNIVHNYKGNSISKLQIQVATYVFELSVGNCRHWIAALSSFIVTHNDRDAHDCTDVAAVTRWRRP